MADYLEKLKKEYKGLFGPVGAAPAIASHEFATEWYRPGATHAAALRKMVADDPTGIGILPSGSESDYTKMMKGRLGDATRIEDLGKEMPMMALPDPSIPVVKDLGDRMYGPISSPGAPPTSPAPPPLTGPPDPYLGAMPGGPTEVDEESGETLVYSMITGRMTGPSGGKYETRLVEEAEAHKAEMARRDAEELEKYGPGGYYASEEYKHKSKLRDAEARRPETLTYWTKDKPWSVEASRERYPEWHPLDTMPAWYTRYYRDPDSAAHDALTVPDMKIWGMGPGKEDPLSGSVGGISFKSPDLKRTFSSDDDAFKDEDGKHTGMIPETPAMAAAMAGEIPEGTRWVTPEWLTPRSRELGGGPKSLYDVPMDSALTDEILREYRPDDPTTRIGPMVIEKEATGVGMDDPPPEYYPTAYPDLAWYTSWGDAERIAGYPASWDYTDVVKDRMKAVAEDRILDPAAEWAGEVTDLDRLVSTFATDYRGEDPREYLEERTDPEYYPLPKYVSGMHGYAGGSDTSGEEGRDWYSKVMDSWYGGIKPEDDSARAPLMPPRAAMKMSATSPEMIELLAYVDRFESEGEPVDPSYDFALTDYAPLWSTAAGRLEPSKILTGEDWVDWPVDTSKSKSTITSRDIVKSWSEDYPFLEAPGGFRDAELRDRLASAYGYSPKVAKTLKFHEGEYVPGWASAKAMEAMARPIAAGAASIGGFGPLRKGWEAIEKVTTGDPDVGDVTSVDLGSSFADYVRSATPTDPAISSAFGGPTIPSRADITKLWAEDVVKPAFDTLTPYSKYRSRPIHYTYPGADAPWLLPSGESPILDFSVSGLFEAAT